VLSVTLLPIVALLIKQDSPGGVFFKQTRVGQGGRHFTFFKLRTMCVDAEARQHEIEHLNKQPEVIFKIPDRLHPFVTGVGKWLRTLSIDELPQLWNVLRGDMTLIGPRPPLPAEVANYKPWQRRRLDFVGGLTCEWQVRGFGKVAFTKGVRLDLDYIRNRNWRVDLMILLRTPAAALNNGIPH
jgi:lipopolysaccharide/colanic/teichoic acid biosynthesis glycosyltransferase